MFSCCCCHPTGCNYGYPAFIKISLITPLSITSITAASNGSNFRNIVAKKVAVWIVLKLRLNYGNKWQYILEEYITFNGGQVR
jgi:hypothetical protein